MRFRCQGSRSTLYPERSRGALRLTNAGGGRSELGAIEQLKAGYRKGGASDLALKRRLQDVLQSLLAPATERRYELAWDPGAVREIVRRRTEHPRASAASVLAYVRFAFALEAAIGGLPDETGLTV